MAKLWGGRFTKGTDKAVEDFTSSIAFDARMYAEDIAGSKAHATMLAKQHIISDADRDAILAGLTKIKNQIDKGEFPFSVALEDIHMNIEKRLTDDIGEAGGRLHTGRSRNDQCAVDLHMYVRKAVVEMGELIVDMQKALIETAEKYSDVIMPGYTHLQRAQPVLFGHHMMAYFSMLERDFDRLLMVFKHADIMPLGAGALAGSTYGIDQTYTQKLLGFSRIYENSMDAVSDRDYVVEFLSFASLVMMHLSRLSEELILWSTNEFNFIELDKVPAQNQITSITFFSCLELSSTITIPFVHSLPHPLSVSFGPQVCLAVDNFQERGAHPCQDQAASQANPSTRCDALPCF